MSPQARDAAPAGWLGPAGQRTDRLELHLSYSCPNRCSFCSEAHRLDRFRRCPVTLGRVATVLRAHLERGVRKLHLTGGEPTVHPDFLRIAELAHRLGMRLSVGTNGIKLSRRTFAERALPLLDEVMVSLHGPDAATHDALAGRRGSFDEATGALELGRQLGAEVTMAVNIVLTRDNAGALPATVKRASELGARLIVVSWPTPEGRALDRYGELTVRLGALGPLLAAAAEQAGRAALRFFGVPMCILGPLASQSNDLHWDPRVTVEWAATAEGARLQDIYSWSPARKRVHPPACHGCVKKGVCAGVFDRYFELYGDGELEPHHRADR